MSQYGLYPLCNDANKLGAKSSSVLSSIDSSHFIMCGTLLAQHNKKNTFYSVETMRFRKKAILILSIQKYISDFRDEYDNFLFDLEHNIEFSNKFAVNMDGDVGWINIGYNLPPMILMNLSNIRTHHSLVESLTNFYERFGRVKNSSVYDNCVLGSHKSWENFI